MTTVDPEREAAVPTPVPLPAPPLLGRALVYVTGKGGAGKTTVAAALGLAAASRGRRTVICDLASSKQLARSYGLEDVPGRVQLTERLDVLSVDPQTALEDWLRRQPGGAAAVAVLTRSRAFAHFVAAAPGVKELVTIGNVVDVGQKTHDFVVVDGPSTGHALGMLCAPRIVGEVAPLGSVGAQARALRDVLADPAASGYVGVSLPEEMSVHEVLELERGLPGAAGAELDVIVVDGVYPDRFTDEEAERLRSLARRRREPAVEAALRMHRRARAHATHVRTLRDEARAPVATLPYLFVTRLGPAQYQALGRALSRGLA